MGANFECRGCGRVLDAREPRFPMKKDENYCEVCYKKYNEFDRKYRDEVAGLDRKRDEIRDRVRLEVFGKWNGKEIVPYKPGEVVEEVVVKTPKGGDKLNAVRDGTVKHE